MKNKHKLFPTLYTLIAKNGESKQVSKSRDFSYIISRKDELKKKYKPSEVEFIIKKSEVKFCRKPYEVFTNEPEWLEYYGVNASGEYYAANKELDNIRKLKIKKEKI